MTYLLDVNVLIALIDSAHVGHDTAHGWFNDEGNLAWATCPITENGVLRILGNPRYPNSAGSPAAVAPIVAALRALPGHEFWNDDISLLNADVVDASEIATPGQVTDCYLLALAVVRGGRLATFDCKIGTKAVQAGKTGLLVIG